MKKMSKGKMVAVGAGVAAVSAGAYYLLGPNKKAHQKKAKILMAKIEKEVENKIKKVKDASAPMYNRAVDSVYATYAKRYAEHEEEIKAYAKKLKSKWENSAKSANNKVKRTVRKTVRKMKIKKTAK